MGTMTSQITGVSIVCSAVCGGADQGKHQSLSLAFVAFVRGIHRSPVDSTHKGTVTLKMSTFDDVIIYPVLPQLSWSGEIVLKTLSIPFDNQSQAPTTCMRPELSRVILIKILGENWC